MWIFNALKEALLGKNLVKPYNELIETELKAEENNSKTAENSLDIEKNSL